MDNIMCLFVGERKGHELPLFVLQAWGELIMGQMKLKLQGLSIAWASSKVPEELYQHAHLVTYFGKIHKIKTF